MVLPPGKGTKIKLFTDLYNVAVVSSGKSKGRDNRTFDNISRRCFSLSYFTRD